jgi:hypothetical protein
MPDERRHEPGTPDLLQPLGSFTGRCLGRFGLLPGFQARRVVHMKMAPVKGPSQLVVVVVAVTAFDDDGLAAMMPAPVQAMVTVHAHFSAGAFMLLLDDGGLRACGSRQCKSGKSGDNES